MSDRLKVEVPAKSSKAWGGSLAKEAVTVKVIQINNPFIKGGKLTLCARYENARSGFRHVVEATQDSELKASCHYENRTWEEYRFQTALHKYITLWLTHYVPYQRTEIKIGSKDFKRLEKRMKNAVDRKAKADKWL